MQFNLATLWEDTKARLGMLLNAAVSPESADRFAGPIVWASIGVARGAGGIIITRSGKVRHVKPRSPVMQVSNVLMAAEALKGGQSEALRVEALKTAVKMLEAEIGASGRYQTRA